MQNYEEITVQTSGAGADVGGGGVRQQLISRRGGNTFSGSGSLVYADGGWQPSALTPELVARGLQQGNKIDDLSTYEFGMGGKIIRDKLWWFGAARDQTFNSLRGRHVSIPTARRVTPTNTRGTSRCASPPR